MRRKTRFIYFSASDSETAAFTRFFTRIFFQQRGGGERDLCSPSTTPRGSESSSAASAGRRVSKATSTSLLAQRARARGRLRCARLGPTVVELRKLNRGDDTHELQLGARTAASSQVSLGSRYLHVSLGCTVDYSSLWNLVSDF